MLNIVHVVNQMAVDRLHQITHQHPRCGGRGIGFHVQHQQSFVDACAEMRAQGLRYKDIGLAFGISEQRVAFIVKQVTVRLAAACE